MPATMEAGSLVVRRADGAPLALTVSGGRDEIGRRVRRFHRASRAGSVVVDGFERNEESRYQARFTLGRVGVGTADHPCPIGRRCVSRREPWSNEAEKLCCWPPYSQVFAPLDGVLRWSASAEELAREERDVAGRRSWVMRGRCTVTLVGRDRSHALDLPAMAEVRVPNGAAVHRGDRIAVDVENDLG